MPRNPMSSRRQFLGQAAGLVVASRASAGVLQRVAPQQAARQWLSRPEDHFATGTAQAVASTSREASESAFWALGQGGNASDAYLTAALTQTVVEHGLTSIAGGFSINYYEDATEKTTATIGPLGAAKNEPYDFDRHSPLTQTGRAMPVPGFLSGLYSTHQRHGRLKCALAE